MLDSGGTSLYLDLMKLSSVQETVKHDEYYRGIYMYLGKLIWDGHVYSCTSLNKYIHSL